MMLILALLTALVLATGCQSGAANSGSDEPTGATFSPPSETLVPQISPDAADIDTSHVADGYVVVKQSSPARLKFQVICGDRTYNYDLPNDGTPTVFPLNMGDGAYRFRIMKNVGGNDYVEAGYAEAAVRLSSEFAPFLIPNQFCDYTASSACVAKAREVVAGAANQGEAVKLICEFVLDNLTYDTAKAERLADATGYVPDPDETLASGTGVCFDYASLGAAMLRSQGIPAKVVTGFVSPGDLYHAWIMVYVDGSWRTAAFTVNPNEWSRVDLTFADGADSAFAGDGTTYVDRYVY